MSGVGENIQPELFERESELEIIEGSILRAPVVAGRVIFIEGPAGVGKTTLLDTAGTLGAAAGFTVLRGRGSELDREFPFGVVRRLFDRVVSDRPELLSGGAESAAPVFTPAGTSSEEVSFAPLHGLYWLVVNLAADRPLMVIADDLHWCDRASLRSLVFTAERLADMPVIVVAATRAGEPGAEQELLDELASTPEAVVLRPEPLSASGSLDLVRGHLPLAVESFGDACHRATGGNPFLLGELLVELVGNDAAGTSDEAESILDFGSDRVGRSIRRRLRMLPDEATRVARAVSVLGAGASTQEIALLAGTSEPDAAKAIDLLGEIHVLQAGGPDFVHPIVRSAVYDQIPPGERVILHVEAADLLDRRDAGVERVAQHLLRVPPEGLAIRVSLLERAAAKASARGAHGAAAVYLQRALREPPDDSEKARILHALGRVEAVDGQRETFGSRFEEALESTEDPDQLARISIDFGWARGSSGDLRAASEILSAGFDRLPPEGVDAAEQLESLMIHFGFLGFNSSSTSDRQRDLRLRALDAGDESLSDDLQASLALWLCATRPPASVPIGICESLLKRTPPLELNSILVGSIGNTLNYCGKLHAAARLYDETLADANRRGDEMTVIWQSVMRSDISLRLGAVRRAEAEAKSSFDRFVRSFERDGLAWTESSIVNALVARGATDEARALLDEYPIGPDAAPSFGVALLLIARANLELVAGSSTSALQDATSAGEMAGQVTNPGCLAWRSAAALALANLDRRDEAVALAREELADASGFAIPDAEGVSLRTLGMVLPGKEGIDELRESVALLERAESRFEHTRSMLELGAALRRAGERREATRILRESLDLASRCGASAMADRAHEELVAAGARPRRDRRELSGPESLTASEERVAALAAEGLTNREIAQRQFVTVKAVEWHLRNVFRKLDISSRDQLSKELS